MTHTELERTLPPNHPLRRITQVLRLWLVGLLALLLWNAYFANGFVLTGLLRPVPFLALSAAVLVWLTWTWSATVTIYCSGLLFIGLMLRATELLLFADGYSWRGTMTAVSLWSFLGATTLVFGAATITAVSRRAADVEVWGEAGP